MRGDPKGRYSYNLYGLSIRSDVPLGPLTVIPRAPRAEHHCAFRFPHGPPLHLDATEADNITVVARSNEFIIAHPRVGEFRIHDEEVVCRPHVGVEADVVTNFLLGPITALILQRRSLLVLHGSAVLRRQGTAGFVGMSGQGKSTLAAALVTRGCAVVSDDLLVVEAGAIGAPAVRTGPTYVRLYPDWAATLTKRQCIPPPEACAPVIGSPKTAYRFANGAFPDSAPLTHIFVLQDGNSVRLTTLSLSAALIALVANTYYARTLRTLGLKAHFSQCVQLARCTRVVRLERPRELTALSSVVDSIESLLASAVS